MAPRFARSTELSGRLFVWTVCRFWHPRRATRPLGRERKDMTNNTKAVLRYYLRLNKPRFRLSLETITEAVFGADPKGTKKRRVQRANIFLRDAGVISWIAGHGDKRAGGENCTPNKYRLDPAAIRSWRRIERQRTSTEAGTGTDQCVKQIQKQKQIQYQ